MHCNYSNELIQKEYVFNKSGIKQNMFQYFLKTNFEAIKSYILRLKVLRQHY